MPASPDLIFRQIRIRPSTSAKQPAENTAHQGLTAARAQLPGEALGEGRGDAVGPRRSRPGRRAADTFAGVAARGLELTLGLRLGFVIAAFGLFRRARRLFGAGRSGSRRHSRGRSRCRTCPPPATAAQRARVVGVDRAKLRRRRADQRAFAIPGTPLASSMRGHRLAGADLADRVLDVEGGVVAIGLGRRFSALRSRAVKARSACCTRLPSWPRMSSGTSAGFWVTK
jgi:hypothetical protein